MDSVDAANLLIAAMAAPINGPALVSSAATCELYSKLVFRRKESTPIRRWRDVKLSSLAALSPDHTFGEALTALIDAERSGESQESRRGVRYWFCDTFIRAPIPFAEIAFKHPSAIIDLKYADDFPEDEERWKAWHSARINKFQAGDLHQSRWITSWTIQEIGALLGKPPP